MLSNIAQHMSFQLQSGEPLIDGIRRISLQQIDQALDQLTNPDFDRDKAVHEARKTCKRLRAILRLVRDEVGYPFYRRENVRIRDASRLLAPARDSAVMVDTLDSLVHRFENLADDDMAGKGVKTAVFTPFPAAGFATLRTKLVERHQHLSRHILETDAVPRFITAVRTARLQVAEWPLQNEGFGAIAGGLYRVYRRGRLRMTRAQENTTTEALHDWRKRVKYLWHQLEFIQPIRPTLLNELGEALHSLSGSLGNEHDLAELKQLVTNEPDLLPAPDQQKALFAMIDFHRKEHQAAASNLGQQLYAEQPKIFVQHLQIYWQAWRTEKPARPNPLTLLAENDVASLSGSLTTRQAADAFALTPAHVRHLIRIGRLPAFKLGHNWVILLSDSSPDRKTQIVSTRQAAAQLGIQTRDVRRLIYKNLLPASKFGPNWGIDAKVLETYNTRQSQSGKS